MRLKEGMGAVVGLERAIVGGFGDRGASFGMRGGSWRRTKSLVYQSRIGG